MSLVSNGFIVPPQCHTAKAPKTVPPVCVMWYCMFWPGSAKPAPLHCSSSNPTLSISWFQVKGTTPIIFHRSAVLFLPPWRLRQAVLPPLGVLVHVIKVWRHDKVLRIRQVVLVGVLLPPRIITLMGDVALPPARLEFPEVQPCLIVLEDI